MVDDSNPMRLAKKAWNHLGEFTRREAIELLSEKLVSQKRRVMMKDCVRIIYYCHVQRSSGCRYEMSVCVPNNPDEKLRIDDFNVHTCNPEDTKLRRRAKPQVEDFDRPIEKRKAPSGVVVSGKGDGPGSSYPFGDTMTNFLNGLSEHFDADHDFELDQNDFGCTDLVMGQNENLVKFISEFGHGTKPLESGASNRPGPSTVWTTVSVEVVDFSKRPDPPFTHVFHALDEASQYSYASPMIGNHPEVVADALITLFFLFGPPKSTKVDPAYRGTALEGMLSEKFPTVNLIFHAEKQGAIAPRREESMIRERIYAWLMENRKLNWYKHLAEIKYMHNSEWIDELGGTPMELFFGRPRSMDVSRKRKADVTLHDEEVQGEICSENSCGKTDVTDDSSSLMDLKREAKNEL